MWMLLLPTCVLNTSVIQTLLLPVSERKRSKKSESEKNVKTLKNKKNCLKTCFCFKRSTQLYFPLFSNAIQ